MIPFVFDASDGSPRSEEEVTGITENCVGIDSSETCILAMLSLLGSAGLGALDTICGV